MQKVINIFIQIIIVSIIFALSIHSQQIHVNLKTLTMNSEVILTGKVFKQKSKWNDNKSRIYTDVTIEVDEYLKGQESESTITVRNPGGEVGEVGELYTHMPSFKKEEEMVLFVKKNNYDGKYRVYDGANGKIEIIKNKASGEKYTTSNKKVADLKKQIKSYQKEK